MADRVRVGRVVSGDATDGFTGALTALDFFGPLARAEVLERDIRIPLTMVSHNDDQARAGDQAGVSIAADGVHAVPEVVV